MLTEESTLIVDDNVDAGRLLCVLLEQLGEQGIYKKSGQEALEYLKNHIPRLILMDAIMPEMSGIDVLQAIRRDPRLAAVPVIILSMNTKDPDFEEYAKEQGAAEYWVKSEVLYKNLKQLLAPYLARASVMQQSPIKSDGGRRGDRGRDMN